MHIYIRVNSKNGYTYSRVLAMLDDHCEVHAIVRGIVQGVGFRRTVQRIATQHHLLGTVSNQPDASVSIFAQGSKKVIEEFIYCLKSLPSPVRVDSVTTDYIDASTPFNCFSILS